MIKLKALVLGAVLTALGATGALAQTIGQTTLSGNECWNAGQGPGGTTTGFVCANVVRNSTGYQLLAAATGTITTTSAVNTLAVNAQPTGTTTFTTPPNPLADGQLFQVCNVTASAWATNVSTVAAASGQTINGGAITTTTLAAHSCVELIFVLSTTTWYQIR